MYATSDKEMMRLRCTLYTNQKNVYTTILLLGVSATIRLKEVG
jgi:hypothetical protein